VQVYVSLSPAVSGLPTEGPFAGEKSEVTFSVTLPEPDACEVRTWYVKLVVPVKLVKLVPVSARGVEPLVMLMVASAPIVTVMVVVPEAVACANAAGAKASVARIVINESLRIALFLG
jgi:hypothetical protein